MEPNPSKQVDINLIRWLTSGGLGYVDMLMSLIPPDVSIPPDMIVRLETMSANLVRLVREKKVLAGINPDSPMNP